MSSYSVQALDGSGQPLYDSLTSDGPGFSNRTTAQVEDHELWEKNLLFDLFCNLSAVFNWVMLSENLFLNWQI